MCVNTSEKESKQKKCKSIKKYFLDIYCVAVIVTYNVNLGGRKQGKNNNNNNNKPPYSNLSTICVPLLPKMNAFQNYNLKE